MSNMSAILDNLAQETEKLTKEAEDLFEEYILGEHGKNDKKSTPEDERAKYIPIIRHRNNGVSCAWGAIGFIKPGGKWKRVHNHIPIGQGQYRYKMSKFPKAPEWQIKAIEELEPHFEVLRRKTERLTRMSKAVKQYMKDFPEA